ncbi:FHA domain-containing protein [Pelatocladus sp. BLCC-F211]|uniref:FHA domain-containing protein n=1 Tax=Pelatocladus sp. BLCC-F211 TaxID=3342752 RepID=UPI0035B92D0B
MPVNRCPNPNCEYFNRTLPSNANICPMCGTTLGNVVPNTPSQPTPVPPTPQPHPKPIELPTNRPAVDSTQYQPRNPYPQPAPPVPVSPPSPKIPLLKLIHSSGREFHLPGEGGYIGRRSQSIPVPPEIDLTGIPNDGIISRHHGRIHWDWSQNAYMIVDMSTNGIYLNGNILNPGVPYRLINGDSLQLGQNNLVCFTVAVS